MLDLGECLPKNLNGFRTSHTCELCGFEPKTKNKYREKQDHLVMKHFKEKIDKIFPHCRPYTCPSDDCNFTGKDKQALLRHYTGKHGILEKYLREALAEKGIHYTPGEHGSKRRCSTSSDSGGNSGNPGNPKNLKQPRMTTTLPPNLIEGKDFLSNTPIQIMSRPNTEELRKEVEAMMASFQPQPLETSQMVLSLPTNTQMVTVSLPTVPLQPTVQYISRTTGTTSMPMKIQLPQHPTNVNLISTTSLPSLPLNLFPSSMSIPNSNSNSYIISNSSPEISLPMSTSNTSYILSNSLPGIPMSNCSTNSYILSNSNSEMSMPTSTNSYILSSSNSGQLIMTSRLPPMTSQMSLPPLVSLSNGSSYSNAIMTSSTPSNIMAPSLSSLPLPLEMLSNSSTSLPTSIIISSNSPTSMLNSDSSIIENEEIMWGSGLGPNVVVEAADTLPITYIETADGSYAATLDHLDYDILIPGGNGVDSVRERQLDFCML